MLERIFLTTPEVKSSPKIVKQGQCWSVRKNLTDNHRNCLLVIPTKKYIGNDSDILTISPNAWMEWGIFTQWANVHYQMKGGAIVLRFGDPKRSGNPFPYFSTIIHEPDGSGPVNAVFVAGNTAPLIPTDFTRNQNLGDIEAAARSPEYYAHMQETVAKGVCCFCDKEAKEKTCIKEGEFWWIKPNDFPYRRHAHHFVIVLKGDHYSTENDLSNISPDAWAELGKIIQWAAKKYGILGGGIVLRFGLRRYNASTLTHVHAHIQAPDLTYDNGTTVARAVLCKGM